MKIAYCIVDNLIVYWLFYHAMVGELSLSCPRVKIWVGFVKRDDTLFNQPT